MVALITVDRTDKNFNFTATMVLFGMVFCPAIIIPGKPWKLRGKIQIRDWHPGVVLTKMMIH